METTETGIRERLERVRGRIDAACARSGRDTESVTLVGVAKTFSPETVRSALEAGLADIGENRVQELLEKADALDEESREAIRWHFIGHLQRNKVRHLLTRGITLVHTVDSVRLARAIGRISEELGQTTDCLIQINTSGEDTKHGVSPLALRDLLSETAQISGIRIRGLMAIPAPTADPEMVRPDFAALRELVEKNADLSPLEFLSMGMSADLEVAVEEGATHVRVGTAIFGLRDTCRIG
jgi:pyridoxal phosphate enzyme (YggS family)